MISKTEVLDKLHLVLDTKIKLLQQTILGARESQANDTKSSAGDKFETGRSMMQMEISKNEAQLQTTKYMKHELSKIDATKKLESVQFGSIIQTSSGSYFISLPLGKVEIEKTSIFCISLASPIGKALFEKKSGDKVEFQGRSIEILNIY